MCEAIHLILVPKNIFKNFLQAFGMKEKVSKFELHSADRSVIFYESNEG